MRILICDDDILIMEQLERYINSFFKNNHLKCPEIIKYTDGQLLLSDKNEKDIVFLDIEMPGTNGIYIGHELKKQNKNSIILVITSYSEYLDEAMRFHVFRYLSKPLDKQRLFRNLKDALSYHNTINIRIPIETKESIYTLPISHILSIEAQNKKIIVHTIQRDFISIHNLNYWIDNLPKNIFYQTHRSFIVNFEHITDFDHNLIHLGEKNLTAYLTRRKYTAFKNSYLLYLESMR